MVKNYLVKGVLEDHLKDSITWIGVDYPKYGPIEANFWSDNPPGDGVIGCIESTYEKGISGIDDKSFSGRISLGNSYKKHIYLIIEYDSKDGVRRYGREFLSIKKGFVVYHSAKISEIQKWLEEHGQKYFGEGANITVGDNQVIIMIGRKCTVKAGNSLNLTGREREKVFCGDYSAVSVGNRSVVVSGENSCLFAGVNSVLCSGNKSTMCAGEGSTLIWKDKSHCEIVRVTGKNNFRYCYGEIKDGKFTLKDLTTNLNLKKWIEIGDTVIDS